MNVHMSIIESPLRKHNSEKQVCSWQTASHDCRVRGSRAVANERKKWFMNLYLSLLAGAVADTAGENDMSSCDDKERRLPLRLIMK